MFKKIFEASGNSRAVKAYVYTMLTLFILSLVSAVVFSIFVVRSLLDYIPGNWVFLVFFFMLFSYVMLPFLWKVHSESSFFALSGFLEGKPKRIKESIILMLASIGAVFCYAAVIIINGNLFRGLVSGIFLTLFVVLSLIFYVMRYKEVEAENPQIPPLNFWKLVFLGFLFFLGFILLILLAVFVASFFIEFS